MKFIHLFIHSFRPFNFFLLPLLPLRPFATFSFIELFIMSCRAYRSFVNTKSLSRNNRKVTKCHNDDYMLVADKVVNELFHTDMLKD